MHAAAAGQVETVQFLLDSGADINKKDNMRWSALHHAVTSGGANVTKLLIDNGADVNSKTINDATVLTRDVAYFFRIQMWAYTSPKTLHIYKGVFEVYEFRAYTV